MAVNYVNSLKDTRMQAVQQAVDLAPGFGSLEICTASFAAVIVAIALQKPSFAEAGQQITLNGAPLSGVATLAGTNTAVLARIKDGGGNVIINNLAVGQGAGDISLNSTAITNGQTVTITSGTIAHAP